MTVPRITAPLPTAPLLLPHTHPLFPHREKLVCLANLETGVPG